MKNQDNLYGEIEKILLDFENSREIYRGCTDGSSESVLHNYTTEILNILNGEDKSC